ncbi:hypothetical protein G3I76_22110 [Streptomyces sp. SID11233]|uniref:hypothetical protein n=1 Tax=Streptomyces sp. SID11385 TaxID=2706031 RepID=UPI0013BF6533|nr:hypothetical protein [Streptomyces sp. SID11385]NEA40931.1 hypothetical protein [Streptomyces sp. SID11385]NED82783.1 hypothetical protein [Streptomyces sp. SID11233]
MSDSMQADTGHGRSRKPKRGTVEYGITLPQGEHCAAAIVQSPKGTITTIELPGGKTIELTQLFVEPPDA